MRRGLLCLVGLLLLVGCGGVRPRSKTPRPEVSGAAARGFLPGNYANRPTAKVLASDAVVGVLLSARWRDLEPVEGEYHWDALDHRVEAVAAAGKVVVLNIMTVGVNVPDWLLRKPGVATFSFEGTNPHQPIFGQRLTAPLYWDATYLAAQAKFIRALGAHYAGHPAVVGVMVSFLGTVNNDWYIPHGAAEALLARGYTTERLVAVGTVTLERWAEAFPTQALKMPVGLALSDGQNTVTTLADRILTYAYGRYPQRFYAQVNALCTALPAADSPTLRQVGPEEPFALLARLAQHPHQMGFQLLCDASGNAARLDQGNLCAAHAPSCTLARTLDIARSYHPYYIEYWYEDVENPQLYPLLMDIAHALVADNR